MELKNQNNNFLNSKNNTAQNFNGANIGNQNNYYSISNPKVKIQLNKAKKIYIFDLLKNENIKNILFIFFLPLSILTFVVSFSIPNLNLYKFLQTLLTFYMVLGIILFTFNYICMIYWSLKGLINKSNKYSNYILLDSERIEIIKENSVIINFQEIRKIEIDKNYMIGYNVLIYNRQLNPTLTYNVFFREDAFLIKELFEEYLINLEIRLDQLKAKNLNLIQHLSHY